LSIEKEALFLKEIFQIRDPDQSHQQTQQSEELLPKGSFHDMSRENCAVVAAIGEKSRSKTKTGHSVTCHSKLTNQRA